jgi:hypothetical protein
MGTTHHHRYHRAAYEAVVAAFAEPVAFPYSSGDARPTPRRGDDPRGASAAAQARSPDAGAAGGANGSATQHDSPVRAGRNGNQRARREAAPDCVPTAGTAVNKRGRPKKAEQRRREAEQRKRESG